MALFGPPDVKKLTEKKNVKGLTRALLNNDPNIRKAVIEALGTIDDPIVVEIIAQSLGDPDDSVQSSAVEALARISNSSTIAILEKRLKLTSQRTASLEAELNTLKRKCFPQLSGALSRYKSVTMFGGADLPPELRALQEKYNASVKSDERVREAAAEALGKIAPSNPRAKEALAEYNK